MTRLADIQSFIDISRGLRDPAELDSLLASISREMGFDHFALVQHVDLRPIEKDHGHMTSGQFIALSDYPESWVDRYVHSDSMSVDPVVLASQRTNLGFAWSRIGEMIEMKRPHIELLEQGREAGLHDGFTVPFNIPGETDGSCSFVVGAGRELPERELIMAQLVGSYAFEAGRSIIMQAREQAQAKVQLSPRQLECIVLIGQGKTDWEIAKILGLAQSTVKDYINDAKARYQVTKRVQLVLRAVHDGHLPLCEMIR